MVKKTKAGYEFYEKSLEKSNSIELVPQKKGNIPEMAVLLGLISPKFYKIYNLCDGRKISEIAMEMKEDPKALIVDIDKLIKNKMIGIA